MAIKEINIFQSKAFQNLTKWDFWFKNKPSGNPENVRRHYFDVFLATF
jgi:hypothetical protein